MPIKGLSEQRRLPRLGKIRLGIKKKNKSGVEYPASVDYFVCPEEIQAVYGEKPKKLDVIIPVEDEEIWANQYYRQYSKTRGLICKGDGEFCRRMIDKQTGDIANRDTKIITWEEGLPCPGRECPDYKAKACQEVMNLQFLLPRVPGMGVWQIDTGSINSIMNINNCSTMIRAMCGHVAWIPLTLTLEPTEVNNPEDGKKKTVQCLHLNYEKSVESLLIDSEKPRLQLIIGRPMDDEAPEDRQLSTANPEKAEEVHAKAEEDIDTYWPEEKFTTSTPTKQASTAREVPNRDPETIKTINDLSKALFEDFGMQPAEWLKETGYKSKTDINEKPSDIYMRIKQVKGGD